MESPKYNTRRTIVRLLSSMGSAKEIQQYLKRFSSLDAKRFAVVKVGGAVLRDELPDLRRIRLLPRIGQHGRAELYDDSFRVVQFRTHPGGIS